MFRITEDPSSGSLVQCLAKNYKNDSTVSVDMGVVGVMAAYSDLLCVCVHTRTTTNVHRATSQKSEYLAPRRKPDITQAHYS
jgi:hypothetical protein